MYRWVWTCVIPLCVLSQSAGATTIMAMRAEELIPISEFVGRVTITRGEWLSLERDGTPLSCGYKFGAQVVDVLKGNELQKEFVSEERMEIGSDYLIYMTSDRSAGPVMLSTNSAMLDTLEQEKSDKAFCEENFPLPRAPALTSSKFTTYRGRFSSDDSKIEWWIDTAGPLALEHADEIDSVYIGAKTIEVQRRGVATIMEESEFLKKSSAIFEEDVAEYPSLYLIEGAMKWADVRALLKELIAEAEGK